ncbi:hypothetical protein OFM21_29705, partial [Escherichia coli]|nr:hypothetical protein [Escherichia coli]
VRLDAVSKQPVAGRIKEHISRTGEKKDAVDLHVEGRIKEQINRAGEKIAAAEVESALLRLAEVQDCAVVAAPDTLLGERICAFIIAQQV